MSKKSSRVIWAEETLSIIEKGYYTVDNKKIIIKDAVANSIAGSVLYKPDGFEQVFNDAAAKIASLNCSTEMMVQNVLF